MPEVQVLNPQVPEQEGLIYLFHGYLVGVYPMQLV
jgi:hypothetical protein